MLLGSSPISFLLFFTYPNYANPQGLVHRQVLCKSHFLWNPFFLPTPSLISSSPFPTWILSLSWQVLLLLLVPRGACQMRFQFTFYPQGLIYILPVLRSPKLTVFLSFSYSSLKVKCRVVKSNWTWKKKNGLQISALLLLPLCLCPATFISLGFISLLPSYVGGILWNY